MIVPVVVGWALFPMMAEQKLPSEERGRLAHQSEEVSLNTEFLICLTSEPNMRHKYVAEQAHVYLSY